MVVFHGISARWLSRSCARDAFDPKSHSPIHFLPHERALAMTDVRQLQHNAYASIEPTGAALAAKSRLHHSRTELFWSQRRCGAACDRSAPHSKPPSFPMPSMTRSSGLEPGGPCGKPHVSSLTPLLHLPALRSRSFCSTASFSACIEASACCCVARVSAAARRSASISARSVVISASSAAWAASARSKSACWPTGSAVAVVYCVVVVVAAIAHGHRPRAQACWCASKCKRLPRRRFASLCAAGCTMQARARRAPARYATASRPSSRPPSNLKANQRTTQP